MRPRLVATDLDGTLLHTDGTVTHRSRRVLRQLEDRGVPVVFVTGRPIRWMEELWVHVGGHGIAICSNGGIVYDVPNRKVVTARTIEGEVATRVAQVLRRRIPGTTFALENTRGFAHEAGFLPQVPPAADVPVGPLEEILDTGVVKLLARHEQVAPEAFWQQVEELVGDLVSTTWSSTGTLVEISAHGVTKASTLAMLCADLGIRADEVVAFGDMPNDLGLLAWAGASYAMANAHPLVHEVAGNVAPANDQDGVAAVLERIFDLPAPTAPTAPTT